jgi:phosphoribosylaminoimidazolecarboxamide formyltransferase/IMP cyclohydrolase
MRGTDVTDMKRKYRTVVAGEFPGELALKLTKGFDLRYGENPNQPAAVYEFASPLAKLTDIRLAKSGKGGLSATNLMDVARALDILKFFERPSVAVMKHLVPSGFAKEYECSSLDEIYMQARDADARSAFGSVVVFNCPVSKMAAESVVSTYVEGVAAPEYEDGALGVLETKKDLRAMLYSNLSSLPRFVGDDTMGLYDMKVLPTGRVVVQAPYLSSIRSAKDLVLDPLVRKKGEDGMVREYVVDRDPAPQELDDLLTAWYVNIGVRSNGIVIVKDGVTLAVGSGQQERVGAVEQAITKAYQKAMDREGVEYDPLDGAFFRHRLNKNPLEHAVMSSDAFFPFRDSLDIAACVGISAVIQPGGSLRDDEVIRAANENDMAMAFTLERCFGHF